MNRSSLNSGLSFNSRKALSVHLGEAAGEEIADLIRRLTQQVEKLERSKVDVTHLVPDDRTDD